LLAGTPLDDLDLIEPDKIFVVRLADVFAAEGPGTATPDHTAQHRVFPGDGLLGDQVAALVLRLADLGFRGDYSFEVFNDDYRQLPPRLVSQRARVAAEWLGEDVLRRSVPLPGQMRLRPARSA